MKALIISACITAAIAPLAAQDGAGHASFRVIIRAVDDIGAPVVGADAGFGWGPLNGTEPNAGDRRTTSNQNGEAVFEGHTDYDGYAYGARKEGYYPAWGIHSRFDRMNSGHWEPWGKTIQLVLKPIKNPVPMYAKELLLIIPALGKPLGYDLEKGDWVAPYGKGERKDFEFLMESNVESRNKYQGTLSLRLPGEGNGIQAYDSLTDANALKLFYEAPIDGYAPTWSWAQSNELRRASSRIPGGANHDRTFIFRVRSILDSQGKVVGAWYGKIYGPGRLQLRSDSQWQIELLYYLNPDSTRNLEFDPKRNLFKDENVLAP